MSNTEIEQSQISRAVTLRLTLFCCATSTVRSESCDPESSAKSVKLLLLLSASCKLDGYRWRIFAAVTLRRAGLMRSSLVWRMTMHAERKGVTFVTIKTAEGLCSLWFG